MSCHGNIIAGEQKRARSLFLRSAALSLADLKQNVGTFLAFLCSSNWNEWYVSKRRSKGPGVEFKVRGHCSREFRE